MKFIGATKLYLTRRHTINGSSYWHNTGLFFTPAMYGKSSFDHKCSTVFSAHYYDRPKKFLHPNHISVGFQTRNLGWIPTVIRSVLKIRYLILGGAIGGGATLAKQYEEWKSKLPDINELMPKINSDKFRAGLIELARSIHGKANEIELDPRLAETLGKFSSFRMWFENRLKNAVDAEKQNRTLSKEIGVRLIPTTSMSFTASVPTVSGETDQKTKSFEDERDKNINLQKKLEAAQNDLMKTQIRYQKEIEKIERQNKELKKQLLIKGGDIHKDRKIKKSLIDMYSDVLDELGGYDSSYNTADHLPRVVVVGDQSSGKTSVLEMVAQARIFPRGAGEMMTRAPVMVTLSEGPYHIAQLKDDPKEFDLSKESDLEELRSEIEIRMKKSVTKGNTISNQVISMTVKGPGINRMVLVDLPGIISTVTTGMNPETRNNIKGLVEHYMANPNAIILCVQDGSVDAERSNVTDIVSNIDPTGKRTIFVLTKVDMAEQNLAQPDRIQKILTGKLFPMKALGYFAVVTGKGNKNDTIQDIRNYEEEFFSNSKIFKGGLVGNSQMTTKNLSFAVAECFWKMVQDTIEQQADAFKATRFNLETEWKNNYQFIRELDRDELFEKARGEILDEIINLSQISAGTWEEAINKKLWQKVAPFVFENIFLSAYQSTNQVGGSSEISTGTFNTTVDIKLKNWTESQLAAKCVEVGWETLSQQFLMLMERAKRHKDHDTIFDNLKEAVIKEAMKAHKWEKKAPEMLRVIQLNALEDRSVPDKYQWDSAVKFLDTSIKERLLENQSSLNQQMGPGLVESWLYWKSSTADQMAKRACGGELEKLLVVDLHSAQLSHDEITTVKRNLMTSGIDVSKELIKEAWHPIFRRHFLQRAQSRCYDCSRGFYLYQRGITTDVDCNEIVLFWRIQQMLRVTANALRQQIVNREAKNLEKQIKEVLETFSQDPDIKAKLLIGRRVVLAEELKRVRHIQERLEDFIRALNDSSHNGF